MDLPARVLLVQPVHRSSRPLEDAPVILHMHAAQLATRTHSEAASRARLVLARFVAGSCLWRAC